MIPDWVIQKLASQTNVLKSINKKAFQKYSGVKKECDLVAQNAKNSLI